MTTVSFYVDDERAGRMFRRATEKIGLRIRKASKAATDAAADIGENVRDDITVLGWTVFWRVGRMASRSTSPEGGGSVRVRSQHLLRTCRLTGGYFRRAEQYMATRCSGYRSVFSAMTRKA